MLLNAKFILYQDCLLVHRVKEYLDFELMLQQEEVLLVVLLKKQRFFSLKELLNLQHQGFLLYLYQY